MKKIQSKLHRIGVYDVCKISMSYFDDKRYILDDGINSFDYCMFFGQMVECLFKN